jgi:hypothetical protein
MEETIKTKMACSLRLPPLNLAVPLKKGDWYLIIRPDYRFGASDAG